jgi:hypothetical protein
MRELGKPGHVKVIFSQRGGHTYGHTFAYGEILKQQSRAGTTVLQKRTINWQVVDRRLLEELPHTENARLQLADVVASSFYQAVDTLPPTRWNAANAKLLPSRSSRRRRAKRSCFRSREKFLNFTGMTRALSKGRRRAPASLRLTV